MEIRGINQEGSSDAARTFIENIGEHRVVAFYGAMGAGEFIGWGWLTYSFVFMLVLLALGILIFNKVQRNFMDTV